jgi:ACS family tartrate transporter-like MFS transporter
MVLVRIGARVWISMATWGVCSAGAALITGETSFIAVRFLLGIAEAFPGVAYFIICWFPAFYRGRMIGVFYAFGAFAGLGASLAQQALKASDGLDRRYN